MRGIEVRDLVKTIVVRRGDGDYIFVLVPGDREFSWSKLRSQLGVSRLSMPDAAEAKRATGYERGTITPFGATHPWPVFADSSIVGRSISMGGGASRGRSESPSRRRDRRPRRHRRRSGRSTFLR